MRSRARAVTGRTAIGVDPGGRYTAVVAIAETTTGYHVLEASTLKRGDDDTDAEWVTKVVDFVAAALDRHPDAVVGVETVVPPRGFHRGEKAFINPGSLIGVAVIYGAVLATWPDVTPVRPGGNGSRGTYPAALTGRAPAGLSYAPPAGTRQHEKSAFDIARKVLEKSP